MQLVIHHKEHNNVSNIQTAVIHLLAWKVFLQIVTKDPFHLSSIDK